MLLTVDINYLDAFKESDHPRGQPQNKGEFASAKSGGGSSGSPLSSTEIKALQTFTFRASKASRLSPTFNAAVKKLPVVKGTVYRGMQLSKKALAGLQPGVKFKLPLHSSGSTDINVGTLYAKAGGSEGLKASGNQPVLFVIKQHSAGRIPAKYHPEGSGAKEVILKQGTQYKVVGVEHNQPLASTMIRHGNLTGTRVQLQET